LVFEMPMVCSATERQRRYKPSPNRKVKDNNRITSCEQLDYRHSPMATPRGSNPPGNADAQKQT
jgi:hypothetical protein